MFSKQAMVRTIETQACLFSTGNHYLYIYIYISRTSDRTSDRDFRCFYLCEIFLSHTPVPALGKDKNK